MNLCVLRTAYIFNNNPLPKTKKAKKSHQIPNFSKPSSSPTRPPSLLFNKIQFLPKNHLFFVIFYLNINIEALLESFCRDFEKKSKFLGFFTSSQSSKTPNLIKCTQSSIFFGWYSKLILRE